jgi:hypothetical protein
MIRRFLSWLTRKPLTKIPLPRARPKPLPRPKDGYSASSGGDPLLLKPPKGDTAIEPRGW